MIDKEHYFEIAKKYGDCASWAIWADEGNKPKSNIDDLRIFDLEYNSKMLEQLNPNVVMVGLNISRKILNTFGNFHDSRPYSQDYKIRYAFRNTRFYGAYMTDIIKDFEQVISGNVITYLKKYRDFEKYNISMFQKELMDLKSIDPLIIAFGNDSFNILDTHFRNRYRIIKVLHYSYRIGKEDYKKKIDTIMFGKDSS